MRIEIDLVLLWERGCEDVGGKCAYNGRREHNEAARQAGEVELAIRPQAKPVEEEKGEEPPCREELETWVAHSLAMLDQRTPRREKR